MNHSHDTLEKEINTLITSFRMYTNGLTDGNISEVELGNKIMQLHNKHEKELIEKIKDWLPRYSKTVIQIKLEDLTTTQEAEEKE